MAKCLRCGAGSEWIEGNVKDETERDDLPPNGCERCDYPNCDCPKRCEGTGPGDSNG